MISEKIEAAILGNLGFFAVVLALIFLVAYAIVQAIIDRIVQRAGLGLKSLLAAGFAIVLALVVLLNLPEEAWEKFAPMNETSASGGDAGNNQVMVQEGDKADHLASSPVDAPSPTSAPTTTPVPAPTSLPGPATATPPPSTGQPGHLGGLRLRQTQQGTSSFAFDGNVRFFGDRSIEREVRAGDVIEVRGQIGNVPTGTYRVARVVSGDHDGAVLNNVYLERIGS